MSIHPTISVLIPGLAPLPLLLMTLCPARVSNQYSDVATRIVQTLSSLSFSISLLSWIALFHQGQAIHVAVAESGPFGLTLYFDRISAIMLTLVSFLALTVTLYSKNYLAGNPDQGRFFKWLSITSGFALLLIVSGNLSLFVLSWMGISLSLHQLLVFNGNKIGALKAARKKSLFSRLGDMALMAALWIAWQHYGTLDYADLFGAATVGSAPPTHWIALLLVIASMLKSAQFPFHGWLPDTMETPTPVSALMHAGIINAGGFLIIRFSPLIALSPGSLELLAAVGGFTALFASLVMISQTSVKRTLAFSTVAQMGFMMLQCGLGAFSIALLHIVTHSLYKAYTFLSSGSVIEESGIAGSPPAKKYLGIGGALLAFATASILVVTGLLLFGSQRWNQSQEFSLALILCIALAQLLWHWWSINFSFSGIFQGIAASWIICLICFSLHRIIEEFIGTAVAPCPTFTLAWPIALLSALGFLILALRAFLPPSWASTSYGRALFVHAHNGFYVNTLTNRLLDLLWPIRTDSTKPSNN